PIPAASAAASASADAGAFGTDRAITPTRSARAAPAAAKKTATNATTEILARMLTGADHTPTRTVRYTDGASMNPPLPPLEIFPCTREGEPSVCLRDPSGMTEHLAFLPPAAAALLALMNGARTIAEIAHELRRRTGINVGVEQLGRLVGELDEALFLDSPR